MEIKAQKSNVYINCEISFEYGSHPEDVLVSPKYVGVVTAFEGYKKIN
jgi:hypothetical protein